ncbi:methyl-accepting chemotaxis protein [Clostridium thermopalmarium]|uniref:Methyl-accepting chemotaxis protein McpB n=1 Tax=Clostridium thermopalmarium DSM 5974 TaxID=1121340 RepID=A0A2T0ANM0_9CLOT|nr:methyl-accepting chemotaxis protein [Clostridium thermopalmarium]PRR70554.1 Methyl-accepting chemotaxis protein McpB [Clostridium thermopalmarium DSM 5974]PVZ15839.1 methyl-accepting chemotaxis protein [Clostridium thermopalmarium DSM 5974]
MTLSNGGIIQVGIIANEVKKLNQTVSNQNLVDRLGKKSNIVYALTIDPDLKTTAHSDKSRIGITLTDEGSKVAAQEGKMFSSLYNYKGQNVYDVLMPLKDNDTNLGAVDIGLSLENKNAAVKSVAISFTIVAILALIIGGFILRLIINSTLNPLNKLAQAAENVAQGHLTENIDIKSNDEIGNLGVSFNNMVLNLKNMVTKINDISTNLASFSKTLLISAEQVSKVSEEISNSTQEVAGGAEKQLKASKDVSSSMHNVVDDMGNITEQLSGIVKLSEDTSRLAADGREKMNSMVNQIETIKNSVNYTSNIVYELQKNSSEIGNIIEIMDGIADQTNLLALNASIEAARAGEAGRGFAVVADEVRKLAEESMKSSNSIKQLINDTQDRTNRALAAIEEGNRESEKGQELAEIVGQSLNEIIRSFENTKENLEKYNNMIINARNTIDNLDKSIQDIQVISTNTASNTEQVAASTEEQVSVLQEITGNIKKLAEMAADLEDSIKLFQV